MPLVQANILKPIIKRKCCFDPQDFGFIPAGVEGGLGEAAGAAVAGLGAATVVVAAAGVLVRLD